MIIKKAVIVLGGIIKDYSFLAKNISLHASDDTILVAVDSGANHLNEINVAPDLLIGDFDSISSDSLEAFELVEKISFPVEKDQTDGELAIREVIKRGCTLIILYGAGGGRTDHLLCNLMLLELAASFIVAARIENEGETIYLISNSCPSVPMLVDEKSIISLIPVSPVVSGISTFGLKYELNNEKLERGSCRGISNVPVNAVGNTLVNVCVDDGKLLVILNDNEVR